MPRDYFTLRYRDVACDTLLLLMRFARSQLFSVLLSRECITSSCVVRSECINAKAHASAKYFRTAVSNARSETCQKQHVPTRMQLLVLGDCPHREGLPSLKPQEENTPVNPCIVRMRLLTMYCHEIAPSTNAATWQSSLESQSAKNAKMRVMFENCRTYINH
jgi:hypothetical protein